MLDPSGAMGVEPSEEGARVPVQRIGERGDAVGGDALEGHADGGERTVGQGGEAGAVEEEAPGRRVPAAKGAWFGGEDAGAGGARLQAGADGAVPAIGAGAISGGAVPGEGEVKLQAAAIAGSKTTLVPGRMANHRLAASSVFTARYPLIGSGVAFRGLSPCLGAHAFERINAWRGPTLAFDNSGGLGFRSGMGGGLRSETAPVANAPRVPNRLD